MVYDEDPKPYHKRSTMQATQTTTLIYLLTPININKTKRDVNLRVVTNA